MVTATTTPTKEAPKEIPKEGKSVEPVKARTIEDEGIGVRDPYPTGKPHQPTWAEINGVAAPKGE